jgi:FMN-dependent NADH-azoreductase
MNLLHIDSSALGDFSVSRELSAAVATALQAAGPAARYRYRDLAAAPPAHLTGALLQALRAPDGATAGVTGDVQLTDELLQEFLAADVVIIGAPMYNFSVPSTLKAWIDRVAQAGKTFRYTAEGPVGLAGGKRVIIVSTRGSLIEGSAAQLALDHQEAYLRTVFGFFGIADISVLRAEGIGLGPDARKAALAQAHESVHSLVARLTGAAATLTSPRVSRSSAAS